MNKKKEIKNCNYKKEDLLYILFLYAIISVGLMAWGLLIHCVDCINYINVDDILNDLDIVETENLSYLFNPNIQ